jgi:hypothetical protein
MEQNFADKLFSNLEKIFTNIEIKDCDKSKLILIHEYVENWDFCEIRFGQFGTLLIDFNDNFSQTGILEDISAGLEFTFSDNYNFDKSKLKLYFSNVFKKSIFHLGFLNNKILVYERISEKGLVFTEEGLAKLIEQFILDLYFEIKYFVENNN